MKQRASDEFEAWAGGYDRSILQTLLFGPSCRLMLRELHALAVAREARGQTGPIDLLDVGCGTGQFAAMAGATGLCGQIFALDYAYNMVRKVAENQDRFAPDTASTLVPVQADAEHLPLASGSIDLLTCANSFHHYPHQAACIREFARVLRPGGRLVLVDGCRDTAIGYLIFDVCVSAAEGGVHHASHEQVRGMFAEAGLGLVRQAKHQVFCPVLVSVGEVRGG